MSDSVRPHRRKPTRLRHPWASPGKNTGVGCHFLLQCMKVKSESEVAQSCLTLHHPWTAAYQAPPSMGFSRQEWGAIAFSIPGGTSVFFKKKKKLICQFRRSKRHAGLILGAGRSPGNPLQYSCLENPIDKGVWWATVHRVEKSWT